MSLSTEEYDPFVAQASYQDPEALQDALDVQRSLSETLLTIAQRETDDPEKQEMLTELEEQAHEIGLISTSEDEYTCNCSCSASSSSFPSFTELVEANDADLEDVDGSPSSLSAW